MSTSSPTIHPIKPNLLFLFNVKQNKVYITENNFNLDAENNIENNIENKIENKIQNNIENTIEELDLSENDCYKEIYKMNFFPKKTWMAVAAELFKRENIEKN
jgi:hypothetical protein